MPWVVQHFSDYGSATPAVARTALQGRDIFDACKVSEDTRHAAFGHLFEVQNELIRCLQIRDKLRDEVRSSRETFRPAPGNVLHLPGVADLQGRAATFFQAVKFAIRETGLSLAPFFPEHKQIAEFGHQFQKLRRWSEATLGKQSRLTETFASYESYVRGILKYRDALDHPKNVPGGRLEIRNFSVLETAVGWMLVSPTWGLRGGPQRDIVEDMTKIIDQVLRMQEDVVCAIFEEFKAAPYLTLAEIPEEARDPSKPQRFKIESNIDDAAARQNL